MQRRRLLRYRHLVATTKTIELRTVIPGPRSKEILERKEKVVAGPLSILLPVVIDHAEGATLTDVDGNTFVDFSGGVGCLNVGHSHPRVVAVLSVQRGQLGEVQGVRGAVRPESGLDLPGGRHDLLSGPEHAFQPDAQRRDGRGTASALQVIHQPSPNFAVAPRLRRFGP